MKYLESDTGRFSRRRGFMLADVMVGIAILALLAAVAATCAGWQRRASREMADLRNATDLAEATLINLHQGLPAPRIESDQIIKVEPAIGGGTIAGYSWVRVTVACRGHSVSLIGLSKG